MNPFVNKIVTYSLASNNKEKNMNRHKANRSHMDSFDEETQENE